MDLLADENFPLASVTALRDAGHDVLYINEESPGLEDEPVLQLAVQQERILLTFDRDFGRLAFLRGADCPPGVVLLRFRPRTPSEAGKLIIDLARNPHIHFAGNFTVLDRERVRQRRLPRNEDR
jgi:predicted nuclease of predicted toxin-antitoxin system